MKFSKVEGHTNLVRDQTTNAIINTDMNEYRNYKSLQQIKEDEKQKIRIS
jgi:hypothetical protein